ncbi:MAG: transposase [Chloroflexota bacterium]|nr:transposase [Chloroflexota bacterium]
MADLRDADQHSSAETVLRGWEEFVTFYHYPKEHWTHLWTANPLESVFGGMRLRTDAANPDLSGRDNALYLVFKIVQRLSGRWRALNGGANLMALVLAGCSFKDGLLQRREARQLRRTEPDGPEGWKGISTTLP